jgi:hypothetical protein
MIKTIGILQETFQPLSFKVLKLFNESIHPVKFFEEDKRSGFNWGDLTI